MRSPSFFHALIALAIVMTGSIAIVDRAAQAAGPAPDTETELSHKMDQMNSAFRKLRRQVGDPAQNANSLEQLAVFRDNAKAAVELQPLKVTEVPASGRARMIEGYRARMKEMLALLDKLQAALQAQRNEEAAGVVQEIVTLQKTAHKEYKSKSFD